MEGGREEVNSSSARTPLLYMNDCSQRLLIDYNICCSITQRVLTNRPIHRATPLFMVPHESCCMPLSLIAHRATMHRSVRVSLLLQATHVGCTSVCVQPIPSLPPAQCWMNDRDLLHAAAVTRRMERIRPKRQHRRGIRGGRMTWCFSHATAVLQ